jgi:uncharacterized phiE125 gp8 family phage protein
MLTIVEPAESHDLTMLATVKTELGIEDDAQDEFLSSLITQASGIIEDYCKRVFAIETVEETVRLDQHRAELVLARYPVAEIVSVTVNDETLTESDYELNPASGILTRLYNDRPCWWPACKLVIRYECGFEALPVGSPGAGSPARLPSGIERACINLVKSYHFAAGRDLAIRSEITEDLDSVAYSSTEALPAEVAGLLAPHRNRRLR